MSENKYRRSRPKNGLIPNTKLVSPPHPSCEISAGHLSHHGSFESLEVSDGSWHSKSELTRTRTKWTPIQTPEKKNTSHGGGVLGGSTPRGSRLFQTKRLYSGMRIELRSSQHLPEICWRKKTTQVDELTMKILHTGCVKKRTVFLDSASHPRQKPQKSSQRRVKTSHPQVSLPLPIAPGYCEVPRVQRPSRLGLVWDSLPKACHPPAPTTRWEPNAVGSGPRNGNKDDFRHR